MYKNYKNVKIETLQQELRQAKWTIVVINSEHNWTLTLSSETLSGMMKGK